MESMLAAMPGAGDMAAAAEEEAGEDGADMAATQMQAFASGDADASMPHRATASSAGDWFHGDEAGRGPVMFPRSSVLTSIRFLEFRIRLVQTQLVHSCTVLF